MSWLWLLLLLPVVVAIDIVVLIVCVVDSVGIVVVDGVHSFVFATSVVFVVAGSGDVVAWL